MGSYAGVDWAGDKHDVLVCDEAGGELLEATFAHDEQSPADARALGRTAPAGVPFKPALLRSPEGCRADREATTRA
jgi:hypothetical protein